MISISESGKTAKSHKMRSGKFTLKCASGIIYDVLYEGDLYGWHWAIVKRYAEGSYFSRILIYVDISKHGNAINMVFNQPQRDINTICDAMMPNFAWNVTQLRLWDNGFTQTHYLLKTVEYLWSDERRLIVAAEGKISYEDMTEEEADAYVYQHLMPYFVKCVRVIGAVAEYSHLNGGGL